MPFPRIQHGEQWLADLGYLGKVRPVLVASVPFLDHERALGAVNAGQMAIVERALAQVLGLKLAQASAQPGS